MRATSEEGCQAVGHLGREVMISLAQAVIDPAEAIGEDGKLPSETDAARLLDAYISRTLPGRGNEALRRAVRGVVQATARFCTTVALPIRMPCWQRNSFQRLFISRTSSQTIPRQSDSA